MYFRIREAGVHEETAVYVSSFASKQFTPHVAPGSTLPNSESFETKKDGSRTRILPRAFASTMRLVTSQRTRTSNGDLQQKVLASHLHHIYEVLNV